MHIFRRILLIFLVALPAFAAPVAIVVSPGTPVDDLSFADVRKLFLGERQFWNPKLRVVLLMRAPISRERA